MASRVADDSAQPTDPSKTEASARDTGLAAAEPSKTPRRKSAPLKPSSSGKPAKDKTSKSKRPTTQSIKADLDDLEARLKRSSDVTQRSVASLEVIVSALESTLKKSSTAQKGRLTRHVNELTERLDRQSHDMRAAVRGELRAALAEGGVENVDAA
ncbi:MAG: hypothetical protein WBG08_05720, partial [Litorimonas sp.]